MNGKILAATLAAIMLLSVLPAIVVPSVQAQHFPPKGPQAVPACDHSGQPLCVFLHPGVTDSYRHGWSHTLGTLWGVNGTGDHPGTPLVNGQTRQVFDSYLDYAILASASDSIGDFQFDIIVTSTITDLRIYVPPDFKWMGSSTMESVWTDITNDYEFIVITQRSVYDTVGPGWTRVAIGNEAYTTAHSFSILPGVYHVRLFNFRAPSTAGLYFFKIYYSTNQGGTFKSIGASNYPITIVRGELNPAWVEVIARTDGLTAPPYVSGYLEADGTTPEGRAVRAAAWWGPSEFEGNQTSPGAVGALYKVYLFGLPAGTYQITATASGYSPTTTDRFAVDAGQSYHMSLVLYASPKLSVTVWSKHGTGAIPWHNLWQLPYGTNNPDASPDPKGPWRDALFDLYDTNGSLLSFWGTDTQCKPTDSPPGLGSGCLRKIESANNLNWQSPGLNPTATSGSFTLVDWKDLKGNLRGLTSTQWDGHVPWDSPDYVAGIVQGSYKLEAFVTGYVMDDADAYQRTIVVSQTGPHIQYDFQMDLRRSNWIESTLHLPGNYLAGPLTTVTLTATDTAGNERGALSFYATPAMATDGVLGGSDAASKTADEPNWQPYGGGLILEGWNSLFPNYADKGEKDLTQPLKGTINDNHKDYGLNPTASTHSAGHVTLAGDPYTIHLYMSDMGAPSGYNNKGVHKEGTGWYTIIGGDPQVTILLCNSREALSFRIQNASAWVSLRSVDFEVPAHERPWTFPGSEIWIQFKDPSGKVIDTLDPTIYGLLQDAGRTTPGYPIVGAPVNSFGVTPFDIDYVHTAGAHSHIGLSYYGTDKASPYGGPYAKAVGFPTSPLANPPITLLNALLPSWRSTTLPPGEYTYTAFTHAYIMRNSFPMQIPASGKADIEADLIQGGQVRVWMEFFDEGVKTAFNGFVRVEVFNSNSQLVGASIYGQAEPNVFTRTDGGGAYTTYEPSLDWQIADTVVKNASQGAGFGTPYSTFPSTSDPQRAWIANLLYGVPSLRWASFPTTNPSDANRLSVPASGAAAVDVYGFYWYYGREARTWAGGWPTTDGVLQKDGGIKGSVDIPGWAGSGGGLYTVKVWAFDPYGPDNQTEQMLPSDDWRMYSMGTDLTNIQVPWGGVQALHIDMNNMAKLEGTILWYDMFGTLRPLAWARIQATDPAQTGYSYPAYSSGNGGIGAGASDSSGAYLMWLPPGSHDITVDTTEAPQIWSSAAPTFNAAYTVTVQPGWVGGGDSNLSGSGTPIPEVPAFLVPLTLIAALAASVWLLRKNSNTNIPILMK